MTIIDYYRLIDKITLYAKNVPDKPNSAKEVIELCQERRVYTNLTWVKCE
jgi:hypothetical protein